MIGVNNLLKDTLILRRKFSHVVSNDKVAEADNYFSPDVYDDTYLTMELALPNRG